MDDDDLPPRPDNSDTGFTGELGSTVGGVLWLVPFLAVAGLVLWLVTRWL
jgi:hypothetical protein